MLSRFHLSYVQSVYSFTSEELGVGATGPIRTVIHKWQRRGFVMGRATGTKFAMKTINMQGFDIQQRERLIQEVLILGRLHHPNIVKLYEVYETPDAMYLIMELLAGGELYTRLVNSPSTTALHSLTRSGKVFRRVLQGDHQAGAECHCLPPRNQEHRSSRPEAREHYVLQQQSQRRGEADRFRSEQSALLSPSLIASS